MVGNRPTYTSADELYGKAGVGATMDQRRASYQQRMQPKTAATPVFRRGPASQPETVSPREVRPAYDEAAAVAKIRDSFVPKARITDEQAIAAGYPRAEVPGTTRRVVGVRKVPGSTLAMR